MNRITTLPELDYTNYTGMYFRSLSYRVLVKGWTTAKFAKEIGAELEDVERDLQAIVDGRTTECS